ncbi:MAG: SH3 domain-containing protein, partial [Lachnospiraceae bacterium]|nr:SH3 domain-containing protein [Lachnospiraceae bacterium]
MKYYSSKKHVILALLTALFVGILFYDSKVPVCGDTMKSGVVKCSSIDTVNTRTEPSINSEIINKLANGKTVFILEEVAGNDNHTWYYVSYNLDANGEAKTGYIRSDYVTVGDNSLQALSINPGTLSPEFSYDTTRYTASVDYNVTSVEVSAIPTDENSQVVGIS